MTLQTLQEMFIPHKGSAKPAASIGKQLPLDKTFNHALDLPKRTGYGFDRIKITPELAQHYLTFNRNNREVIQSRVNDYADEMLRGEWIENGESIKFSKTAKLIDGQHRLLAVAKAGTTLPMLVVYGCEEEAQVKIDICARRTAADCLALQGLPRWESRIAGSAGHILINNQLGLPLSSNVKRLNREIENFYVEFPAFGKSIQFIAELPRRNTPITHSNALVLHYLFAEKDVAQADSFIERLFTGESLSKTSPIYQLRERLNESQRLGAHPFSRREQYHACIKAWNLGRAGKHLTSSRNLFPRSDEAMPEIA